MNEQDFVDLAKNCVHLCHVLDVGTCGKTIDNLSLCVRVGISEERVQIYLFEVDYRKGR